MVYLPTFIIKKQPCFKGYVSFQGCKWPSMSNRQTQNSCGKSSNLIRNPWIKPLDNTSHEWFASLNFRLSQHGFWRCSKHLDLLFWCLEQNRNLPSGGENTVIYRGIIYLDLLFLVLGTKNRTLPNGGEKTCDLPWYKIRTKSPNKKTHLPSRGKKHMEFTTHPTESNGLRRPAHRRFPSVKSTKTSLSHEKTLLPSIILVG